MYLDNTAKNRQGTSLSIGDALLTFVTCRWIDFEIKLTSEGIQIKGQNK